jgi:hypothetical protein
MNQLNVIFLYICRELSVVPMRIRNILIDLLVVSVIIKKLI